MTDRRQERSLWTGFGLAVALLAIPAVTLGFRSAFGEIGSAGQLVAREIIIFLMLGLLLGIVRWCERLPMSSIGLRRAGTGRSLMWGALAFILLAGGTVAALGLLHALGLSYGSDRKFVPPLWASFLVVLRAGIVEEVFYRGHAIERIEALTGSRSVAALVPLLAFASFHYRQGAAGILIALILGAILTGFYLWRRDLKANIAGHFLIDFIPNLLLPILSG